MRDFWKRNELSRSNNRLQWPCQDSCYIGLPDVLSLNLEYFIKWSKVDLKTPG